MYQKQLFTFLRLSRCQTVFVCFPFFFFSVNSALLFCLTRPLTTVISSPAAIPFDSPKGMWGPAWRTYRELLQKTYTLASDYRLGSPLLPHRLAATEQLCRLPPSHHPPPPADSCIPSPPLTLIKSLGLNTNTTQQDRGNAHL